MKIPSGKHYTPTVNTLCLSLRQTTIEAETCYTMRSFDSLPVSDRTPYWEFCHLDLQQKWGRWRRVCRTLLDLPPQTLTSPTSHDGMQLFLSMPSSGSVMCTLCPPSPQSPMLWTPAPPDWIWQGASLRLHWSTSSPWILKRVCLTCSMCVAGGV